MWYKRKLLCFLSLSLFLFCLVVRPSFSADSQSQPVAQEQSSSTELQPKPVPETPSNLEDKLKNLEMLAEEYLKELQQSEIDWEMFLQKYSELQTAVSELTLSAEQWSVKFENLYASLEKLEESLKAEKELGSNLADKLSKVQSELRFTRTCAIIGGAGTVLGIVIIILISRR